MMRKKAWAVGLLFVFASQAAFAVRLDTYLHVGPIRERRPTDRGALQYGERVEVLTSQKMAELAGNEKSIDENTNAFLPEIRDHARRWCQPDEDLILFKLNVISEDELEGAQTRGEICGIRFNQATQTYQQQDLSLHRLPFICKWYPQSFKESLPLCFGITSAGTGAFLTGTWAITGAPVAWPIYVVAAGSYGIISLASLGGYIYSKYVKANSDGSVEMPYASPLFLTEVICRSKDLRQDSEETLSRESTSHGRNIQPRKDSLSPQDPISETSSF